MQSTATSRIRHAALRNKVMSAEAAAALIPEGINIGMSGFTGAGYPKAVPAALAQRIEAIHRMTGEPFKVGIWTGASTAPELDGVLARADGIKMRLPFQSDPYCRGQINDGHIEFIDYHLSEVAQQAWFGFLGPLRLAIIEAIAITEDGHIVPSSAVGNNKTWLDLADQVIVEVNTWQNPAMEGMHDIYYGTALPPHRKPIPLTQPIERIGLPYLKCDPSKIIAIVETHGPDRNSPFAPPDETSRRIAGHIIEFLEHEVHKGRLPSDLLPLQSGVGNVANAMLSGLQHSRFERLTAFTEVMQDGMLELIDAGKLVGVSATSISLSPDALERFNENLAQYRDKIVLRPQEMSNHPELVRRLGVIAMNGIIEADIYGNINSTHIMGSQMMNGIGGSGDFARNGFLSIFMTPSTAKGGTISSIVPAVSHVDHTEHDVKVIVTEQGLADLRGLSPKQRARTIIANCAHPDYRDALADYFERALAVPNRRHTPMLLNEALSWHQRYLETGRMS